jgi:hypothetical protein
MPPGRALVVLRVVVRDGFAHGLGELSLRAPRNARVRPDGQPAPMPHERQPVAFHH